MPISRLKDDDYVIMDNFQLKVVAHGRKALEYAIKLALLRHRSGVKHWAIHARFGMILFWMEPTHFHKGDIKKINELPAPYSDDEAVQFVWQWLSKLKHEDIRQFDGPEPGIDGDVDPDGFEVSTNEWGHGGGMNEGVVAIRPAWRLCGK